MNQNFTIALDAMGGDYGPSVVVPAALQVLLETPQLNIVLVGDEETLLKELSSRNQQPDPRLTIQHASQQVAMDEKPSVALRTKKE